MNVVIICQLYGKIFRGFDFQPEHKVAEQIVRKLGKLGRILRFAGDGIRLDKRIV